MNQVRESSDPFLARLQEHAIMQARLESTSWLPNWSKPSVALIGQHFALMLFVISLLLAVPVTILTFPYIFRAIGGM